MDIPRVMVHCERAGKDPYAVEAIRPARHVRQTIRMMREMASAVNRHNRTSANGLYS